MLHPHHVARRAAPCTCFGRGSRDLIYAALLRSMSPEHKFNSAAKLCGEVFAGVADGLLPLSECEEVLRDALCLMASKEIKVCLRTNTRPENKFLALPELSIPCDSNGQTEI